MDELPRDAKDLLALARMADEPPAAARDRVRNAVALTLSAGAGAGLGVATSAGHAAATEGAGHAALKAGFLSTLRGKLVLVSSVVMVIGTGALLLPRATWSSPRPSPRAAVAASARASQMAVADEPVVRQASETVNAEVPVPAPTIESAAPQSSSLESPPVAHVRKVRASQATALDESLRAEMMLLHDASTALDRGEIEQARGLLNAHRAQFSHGQLREERQGLEVLVRCMANDAGSQNSARAYLRSAPQGVLSARIAGACIARGKP